MQRNMNFDISENVMSSKTNKTDERYIWVYITNNCNLDDHSGTV